MRRGETVSYDPDQSSSAYLICMASGALAPPVVLTIAGFDPSSGAGATADLQVFATHGLFGTACLSALTVQSTVGVCRVSATDPDLLREMLDQLTQDLPASGVKVGMLGGAAIVQVVADYITALRSQREIPVVVDPVLRSSSGTALLEPNAVRLLVAQLLPHATCITPNCEELATLLESSRLATTDLVDAARALLDRTGAGSVIVTGGEEADAADLVLERDREPCWLSGEHIATRSTHGTGCAFSSALLSRLVLGEDLLAAAQHAKRFVEGGLRDAPGLGSGRGPLKLSKAPYQMREALQ